MDAIANIMNLFIFVFCILFVNIDKTVVCTSVKSIKSLSLSLSLSLNGVKQGGITSTLFFCVYINDLLNLLESKGIGCNIGPQYCGAFSYADDIILLCPSVKGTNEMLKLCQDYANT